MRYLLPILLAVHTANAGEKALQSTSLYLVLFFLVLFTLSIYAFYVNKCNQKNSLIQEKEKEIIALHQHHTEQEREHLLKVSENEKEILSLEHAIADMERKLQEGTKNQVVAKIEALQKKRHNRENDVEDS